MGSHGFPDIEAENSAVRANQQRLKTSDIFRKLSTPDLAATVSAVAEMYPNIQPAVIITTAMGGIDGQDDLWVELDERSKKDREDRWANTGFAPMDYMLDYAQGTYGLAKATVRGGMILFDTLWEEGVVHPLRTNVLMYQDSQETGRGPSMASFGSAWSEASASTGVRAVDNFFDDPAGNFGSAAAHYLNLFLPFADPFEVSTEARVNVGSGYFATSDLIEADDSRVQRLVAQGHTERDAMMHLTERSYGTPVSQLFREGADAVRITGRGGTSTGVSPGRLLATTMMEPGSQGFNILSGTMDFGAQVFLDPSNVVGGWLGKARLASRAMNQMDDAPGLIRGIRRTVFQQDVDKALNSNIGRGALDFLSNTDDLALINDVLAPATRTGSVSNELLRQVQVTNTPEEMFKVIRGAVGGKGAEINKKLWNTSVTSTLLGGVGKGTVRGRLLNQVNQAAATIKGNKMESMAQYKGFHPRMRTSYMDSTLEFDAATGRIGRQQTGRNRRATSRLFSAMAGQRFDVSNISGEMSKARHLARNLDLDPEETQKFLTRFVNLTDGDLGGTVAAVEVAMTAYRKKLHLAGVSEKVINRTTTIYKDQLEMQKYFVDRVGESVNTNTYQVLMGNGQKINVPAAHTLSEMAGVSLAIPGSPREIRRMTDFLKRTEGAKWWGNETSTAGGSMFYDREFHSRVITRAADSLISGIWKPMVLMRPAWTVRVISEEQVRLAAAGLHSFNHPGKMFIAALGDKNLKLGLTSRKKLYQSDIYGDALSIATDYQQSMSRRAGTWFDSPGGYGAQNWIRVELGAKDYDKWWFRELNQLQSDKVSSDIAKMLTDPNDARSLDDVVDSFMDGDLAHLRDELRAGGDSMRHKQLSTREGAEAYIRSLEARIHLKTGGRYEVLKDDGFWYDDAGQRLRRGDADTSTTTRVGTDEFGNNILDDSAGLLGRQGTRVSTRTLAEHEAALVRSGQKPDEVHRHMNYLSTKGIVDDAGFNRLDADARTVLMPNNKLTDTDIISESRVLEFRIVERGNADLLNAVATGNLRGVDFSGEVNKVIQDAAVRELGALRKPGEGSVNAPTFVKGVDESDVGMLDNMLDRGFDMFMGKPTNRFSRSPAFMRSYWNTVADLADQGLIDANTFNKLETLLTRGGRSVSTENVRKALRQTEEMDNVVSRVERSYVMLEDSLLRLDPESVKALEPAMARLKKLVDSEHYDVGRYNRIIDDLTTDLVGLNDDLVASIGRAVSSDKALDAKQAKVIRQLQDEVDNIQAELKTLEKMRKDFDPVEADDLDIMYEAMGKMPNEHIEGLTPHPAANSPSDLEEALQAEIARRRGGEDIHKLSGRGEPYPVTGAEGGVPVKVEVRTIRRGEYQIDTVYGKTKIEKQGSNWVVNHPRSMPILEGTARRTVYKTKKSAEEGATAQITHLRQDTAFVMKPEVLPGVVPPARVGDDAAGELLKEGIVSPEMADGGAERIRRMREDLGANEDAVRAMEEARLGQQSEVERVRDEKIRTESTYATLPEAERTLLSMAEVDKIAKATALTAVQDLLYDLSKRSNFSDMFRNIFPFSEAWFEIVSTWSRLIQGNPQTLQRFQQAYKGISEDVVLPEGAFNVEGHDGQGFFYVDPRTKQEMFAIPYLTEMLQGNGMVGGAIGGAIGGALGGLFAGGYGRGAAGVIGGAATGAAAGYGVAQMDILPEGESVGLGFSTQGVNMATSSVIPGISPLAAVPMGWIIDRTEGSMNDVLTEIFLPFGGPDDASIGSLIDGALPSWVKRFMQAANSGDEELQRIRANTTMEVAGMMVRRGEGDFSSPEAMKETLAAASKKAGWLFAIRGLATFAGPTAPTFQFNTQADPNGAWFYTNTMVNQWRKTVEAYHGDSVGAFVEFTGLYGLNPQTFMQGKTKTITPHATTKNAYEWQKDNKDLFKKFPGTAQFLNPVDTVDDEFSYPAYVESLKSGARVAIKPKEWAERSNELAANIIMERFRRSADAFLAGSQHPDVDGLQVADHLNDLKMKLIEDYPGYGRQIAGEVSPMSFEEKISELESWTPKMKSSEVGRAVDMYLAARSEAMAISTAQGHSTNWWTTSPETEQIREQMMGIATTIRGKYPSFRWIWTALFAQELALESERRKAA